LSNTIPYLAFKEFLIRKGSDNAVYTLVLDRFKQEVSNSTNRIRRKLNINNKLMIVLFLEFDSVKSTVLTET